MEEEQKRLTIAGTDADIERPSIELGARECLNNKFKVTKMDTVWIRGEIISDEQRKQVYATY